MYLPVLLSLVGPKPYPSTAKFSRETSSELPSVLSLKVNPNAQGGLDVECTTGVLANGQYTKDVVANHIEKYGLDIVANDNEKHALDVIANDNEKYAQHDVPNHKYVQDVVANEKYAQDSISLSEQH